MSEYDLWCVLDTFTPQQRRFLAAMVLHHAPTLHSIGAHVTVEDWERAAQYDVILSNDELNGYPCVDIVCVDDVADQRTLRRMQGILDAAGGEG